jgi:hypothetical protein
MTEAAIAYLKSILPQLWTIGGSHAQRDLFEQVYLDALLREDTGRFMYQGGNRSNVICRVGKQIWSRNFVSIILDSFS